MLFFSPQFNPVQRAARLVIENSIAWEDYIDEGFQQLQKTAAHSDEEDDFVRPPEDSDKLFMGIGGELQILIGVVRVPGSHSFRAANFTEASSNSGNDVIEVGHPCAPPGTSNARKAGHPSVHFGAVASGGMVALDDAQRQEFASEHGILAFDSEFNSVVESVSRCAFGT